MSSKKTTLHRKGHSGGGGGGGGSSSRRGHQHSDSGFGSLSDTESMVANPDDRDFTAADYKEQLQNPDALWEALKDANDHNKQLIAKCEDLTAQLSKKSKDLREVEAQRRGLIDHNQLLEDECARLDKEGQNLRAENTVLRDEIRSLTTGSPTSPLPRRRESPPTMTGAAGPSRQTQPLQRTASTRKTTTTAEKEDQKARMAQRFVRDDQSQTSSQQAAHRESYIEKWGPGGRRPRSSSVAAPTSRGGGGAAAPVTSYARQHYATAREGTPVFAAPRTPTFSNVPRTVGARQPLQQQQPQQAEYDEYFTDGTYHGHEIPLPDARDPRDSRGRRTRR